jgi:hypothetical protein
VAKKADEENERLPPVMGSGATSQSPDKSMFVKSVVVKPSISGPVGAVSKGAGASAGAAPVITTTGSAGAGGGKKAVSPKPSPKPSPKASPSVSPVAAKN